MVLLADKNNNARLRENNMYYETTNQVVENREIII